MSEAGDGETAVQLATELRPALVIMELQMPQLDGISAAEKLSKNHIAPVVLLHAVSQKELVERAIRNSSRPGNVVLDPFGGSGTTLIAAEKSGRVARLIELDPKYVDVIVRRWEEFTGKQATRAADGGALGQAASRRSLAASKRCAAPGLTARPTTSSAR